MVLFRIAFQQIEEISSKNDLQNCIKTADHSQRDSVALNEGSLRSDDQTVVRRGEQEFSKGVSLRPAVNYGDF